MAETFGLSCLFGRGSLKRRELWAKRLVCADSGVESGICLLAADPCRENLAAATAEAIGSRK